MKRRLYILLPLLILLAAIAAKTACGSAAPIEPDAIFLITLDTARADYFDYSLEDNTLTPHFARLASEGQYFENAYALSPITLPSHASIFYSLPAHRLKIYNNGQVQKVTRPTVTQLLKGKGYRTGAVISLGVLTSDFGLNKGFEYYIENFKPYSWIKNAEEVNRDAFDLIKKIEKEKGGREKSFYWVHYSDPHDPYFPPVKDGDFTLSLNGRQVFSCGSTEHAVVKMETLLQPGKNSLVFFTEIPTVFKTFNDCEVKVEYIKYRGFSIQTQSEEANQDARYMEVVPPADWTSKEKNQDVNYYSSQLHSELFIRNKGKKPLPVTLRFHYSLHVNDVARKAFYKEEIRYMDRRFGELIAFLKEQNLYERSAFIVIGDHGEGLGEYRNHFGHIHFLNKLYSRVPLIAAGAGITGQGKRQEPVSTLHIAPTILDLANIKKPGFMLGESLLNPLSTKKQNKILLETYSPEAYFDAFGLIDYPWQIIFYPGKKGGKLEFFDLENDPLGTVNLNEMPNAAANARVNTDKVKKIKTELINSILKISRIITATKGKSGKASQRHREILKSLGYL